MKNYLKKLSELWQNLIKRYSFMAFIVLPFIEAIPTVFLWKWFNYSPSIFYRFQILICLINIGIIIFIYKKEEENSKYINNKFLKNKFINFILFIITLLAIYLNLLTMLFAIYEVLTISIQMMTIINTHIATILSPINIVPSPLNKIIKFPIIFLCKLITFIFNFIRFIFCAIFAVCIYIGWFLYAIIMTIIMICSEFRI